MKIVLNTEVGYPADLYIGEDKGNMQEWQLMLSMDPRYKYTLYGRSYECPIVEIGCSKEGPIQKAEGCGGFDLNVVVQILKLAKEAGY